MDLIYTSTEKWILSKRSTEWRKWQDIFYHYQTSLTFKDSLELTEFLKVEYNLSEINTVYLLEKIDSSKSEYFELKLNDSKIDLQETQMNFLKSDGSLIDWKEWSYIFQTKGERNYHLWTYIGGIAEITREIKLSSNQIDEWKKEGNTYIENLANQLKKLDSIEYETSIKENRRII